MLNRILIKIILLSFVLFLISSQEQNVQQISVCIGNCMYCNDKSPQICLDKNNQSSSQAFCIPFYRGSNCRQQTYGYENIIKQNGTFDGWNSNKMTQCQLVQKNAQGQLVSTQNMTYMGLGTMKASQTLSKTISFKSQAVSNRAIIKFSVGIDDPTVQSYFLQLSSKSNSSSSTTTTSSSTSSSSSTSTSSSTQPNITTTTTTTNLPNGTILTQTISYYNLTLLTSTNFTTTASNTTYNLSSSVSQGRKFMYFELIDTTNENKLIQRKVLSYNIVSAVRTSCGFVYSYELTFNLNKQYSELGIKMYLVDPTNDQKDILWSILNFDFSLGCRGYLVSSNTAYNCDSCLSGFYPKISLVNSEVEECKPCDFRCKTCFSSTICLTCIQNTVLNANSGMCEFSQYFATMGKYVIVTGKTVDVGQLLGSQVVKTQGGVLQLQQPLENTQAFRISFMILYSAAFRNSNQTVKVMINNQTFSFNSGDLPLDVPAIINGISSSSSSIYQTKLSYSVNGTAESSSSFSYLSLGSDINSSSNINVSANTQKANIKLQTAGGEEIAVSNVNVVQFRCSKNCQDCKYSQYTQTSECLKCGYFFDLSTNCLNCANGNYLTYVDDVEQCVKCHSTCKQCTGPEVTDCLSCFDGFELGEMIFDYTCINCIYKSQTYDSATLTQCINSPTCLNNHPLNRVSINQNCQQCLKSSEDSLTTSDACKSCWLNQNLAKSYCQPMPQRGYQLYGSDVSQGVISSQWTSNRNLVKKTIASYYTDLYGVDWENVTKSQITTMTFTQPILPSHRGISIFFTIFKVNTWYTDSSSTINSTQNSTINIIIRSQDKYIIVNNTINVNSLHGYNIYGGLGSGNQMMYTFLGNSQEHSYTGKLEIVITATHTGVFVRDLEVYLGNCDQCDGNKMNYEVYYIPSYSTNDTQTGLDVWLTFNQGVNFVTEDQSTQDKIINSFQFSIDQLGYQNLIPFVITDNQINTWNFVKYFLPVDGTLINATLRVNNSMGYNIYSKISKVQAYLTNPLVKSNSRNLMIVDSETNDESQFTLTHKRLLLNQRLSSTNVQQKIHRYEDSTMDQRKSMGQMEEFYNFFQWFTVLTMIVFAFFGLGIIFQEFSILVQLLFLHIYISTQLLPASFKQPLSRMQKMQNLNFFAYPHARSIEQTWFSNVDQCSPYPFTQYNVDIYFARSFYPIIIINLIYLFWFLVLFICLKFVHPFRTSPNKIVKFFRDIPQRPMNYFDSIWRYQFITTIWASFMQFHYFNGPTAQMRLNLALCIASFMISLIWPVFVMVYTYHQHLVINVQHFLYLYNDIYYRKISSIAQKTSYYMYIAVRFGRYFFYALFIAVFIYQNIIGPVILMAVTLLQIIYILNFSMYRDKVYLMFKLIENFGFIVLQILLLIIYGFSDDTISKDGFISIGYGLDSLYILLIINGAARFIYLGYKKIKEFLTGRYDYGEKGQLQNCDNKSPITMELPTTQRGLF